MADVSTDVEELGRCGRFGPVAVQRYEWDGPYSTSEYLDPLRTYSGRIAFELCSGERPSTPLVTQREWWPNRCDRSASGNAEVAR